MTWDINRLRTLAGVKGKTSKRVVEQLTESDKTDGNNNRSEIKEKANKLARGQFIKWATENLNVTSNQASGLYVKHKNSSIVSESTVLYVIMHPVSSSYMLAEDRSTNLVTAWVDQNSDIDPLVFTDINEAQKIVTYMSRWRGQSATIEKIDVSL